MNLKIFDVEHGACALVEAPQGDRIALIDCGTNTTTGWTPAHHITEVMKRSALDYLIVTNADQDHYANLAALKAEVRIKTFTKNPTLKSAEFEKIKRASGPLSKDAIAYKELLESHIHPVATSFNDGMGGVSIKHFYNKYPDFEDTNNLSCATFVNYGGFQILFPGDLERVGWLKLLENKYFVEEIHKTTILVASHHGRQSGYCAEIFENWGPRAVVVSDKPKVHSTQETVPTVSKLYMGRRY